MKLTRRIEHDEITAESVYGGVPVPEDFANSDPWDVTLRYRDAEHGDLHEMTVPYFTGQGLRSEMADGPSAADVLSCLLSDAASWENAGGSFESWCGEYGYDTDSRKAEQTFRAVGEQTAQLRKFLGDRYNTYLWKTENDV